MPPFNKNATSTTGQDAPGLVYSATTGKVIDPSLLDAALELAKKLDDIDIEKVKEDPSLFNERELKAIAELQEHPEIQTGKKVILASRPEKITDSAQVINPYQDNFVFRIEPKETLQKIQEDYRKKEGFLQNKSEENAKKNPYLGDKNNIN